MLRGPDARLRLITAVLIALLLPIGAKLFILQVLDHGSNVQKVENIVRRQYTMPAPAPGLILDRNSDLLVGNTPVYIVGAEINSITDTMIAANGLSPLLGLPAEKLYDMLVKPWEMDVYWLPLRSGRTGDVIERLIELQNAVWPWLTIEPEGAATHDGYPGLPHRCKN